MEHYNCLLMFIFHCSVLFTLYYVVTACGSLIFTLCEVYTFCSVVTSQFHVSNIMCGGYDLIFRIFVFILCAFLHYIRSKWLLHYVQQFCLCVFCIIMFVGDTILCSVVWLYVGQFLWGNTILCSVVWLYVGQFLWGDTILCSVVWLYVGQFLWGIQYYVQWFGFMLGSFYICLMLIIMFMMVTSSNSGNHVWKLPTINEPRLFVQNIFSGNSYRTGLNMFKSVFIYNFNFKV